MPASIAVVGQETAPDATGYKGFYYHCLDVQTGARTWLAFAQTSRTLIL